MPVAAFNDATKKKIDAMPAEHRGGVIHVDDKGNAVHAFSGEKLGKVQEVTKADAEKQDSMRDKHVFYVIK